MGIAGLSLLPVFFYTPYGTLLSALGFSVSLPYTMYDISHLLLRRRFRCLSHLYRASRYGDLSHRCKVQLPSAHRLCRRGEAGTYCYIASDIHDRSDTVS